MDTNDIKKIVESHKLVLFAKGSKMQPMCGFSANAIHWVSRLGKPFEVVNIFDDPSCRPALVEFSGWPTTPPPRRPSGSSSTRPSVFISGG